MADLTNFIKDELLCHGADMVGIGDLRELPAEVRGSLPIGICVAVKHPTEVIYGIAALPTREYRDWYHRLNEHLDMLVTLGAEALQMLGYEAIAQTRARVGSGEDGLSTVLPHKTVATRAGIGWIGKSALLVTEQFGSMVRISSILTNAPLETAAPVNQSKCGDCMICTKACPSGAVSGRAWEVGLPARLSSTPPSAATRRGRGPCRALAKRLPFAASALRSARTRASIYTKKRRSKDGRPHDSVEKHTNREVDSLLLQALA